MNATQFMKLVSDPQVTMPAGSQIHADYLVTAKAGGWTYGPKRDSAKKTKPNILLFALLSPAVRASNVGPFESVFGWVSEQVKSQGIETLDDLHTFCLSKLSINGEIMPDPSVGERTWRVWCGYARAAEPTHPNLVASYDLLDEGTKKYDLVLNGTALKYLISLIEAMIEKEKVDSQS